METSRRILLQDINILYTWRQRDRQGEREGEGDMSHGGRRWGWRGAVLSEEERRRKRKGRGRRGGGEEERVTDGRSPARGRAFAVTLIKRANMI